MKTPSLFRARWFRRLFAFNLQYRDEWVVDQAAQLKPGTRILDVGAGSCPYRGYFAHCDYFTQDVGRLEPEQLRHGGYGQIDFVGDASEIDTADASFDAVICTEMIEHHPEPVRVVREFGRLLRPGGVLLLTAPLGSGIHQEPYHFYGGFTPYWYRRFLSEAGFDDISIEANHGFFRYFGQESMRFAQLSAPWRIKASLPARILWAPLWLALAPLLVIGFPLLGAAIDRFDTEQRFTIGYHIRARKAAQA